MIKQLKEQKFVETFEGKQCKIIEAARGVKDRNHFISLDDLEEWRRQQPDYAELYSSFFRYYTDDPYVGGVLAGFGIDFDDAAKPQRAQKEDHVGVPQFVDTSPLGTVW